MSGPRDGVRNTPMPCRGFCHQDARQSQAVGSLGRMFSKPGAFEALLASPRIPLSIANMSRQQKLGEVWKRLPHYINEQRLREEVAQLLAPENLAVMAIMFGAAAALGANPLGALALSTAGVASIVFSPNLVLGTVMGIDALESACSELDLEKAAFHFANVIIAVGLMAFMWLLGKLGGKVGQNPRVQKLFARLKGPLVSARNSVVQAMSRKFHNSHPADLVDMGISPKMAEEFSNLCQTTKRWFVVKDSKPESISLINTEVAAPKPMGVAGKTDPVTGVATLPSDPVEAAKLVDEMANQHYVVRQESGSWVGVNKAGQRIAVESNPAWTLRPGQIGRLGPRGSFQPYASDQDILWLTEPGTASMPASVAREVPGVRYSNQQSDEAVRFAQELDAQLPKRLQLIQHGEQVNIGFIPKGCRGVAFGPNGQVIRLESDTEVQAAAMIMGKALRVKAEKE